MNKIFFRKSVENLYLTQIMNGEKIGILSDADNHDIHRTYGIKLYTISGKLWESTSTVENKGFLNCGKHTGEFNRNHLYYA